MLETAFLVVTTDCDQSCGYCFYETGHQRKVERRILASHAAPIFRALADREVKSVVLTGGEPALSEELEGIVAAGASADLDMVLLTAGRGLVEERISAMVAAGLGAVSIAMDGHLARDFKTVRPLAAHLALETPLDLTLIFTLTRKNLDEAAEVLSFASTLSIGLLLEPAYLPERHPLRNEFSLAAMTRTEKRKLDRLLGQWQETYGEKKGASLVRSFYSRGRDWPPFCPMGAGGVVVNADGNVLPCFHREDLVIGNVIDEDPGAVLARRGDTRFALAGAPCFGEHCLSLFMNS